MTGSTAPEPSTSDGPPSASDREAVEMFIARAGLPASDDEIEQLAGAYQSIHGPVAALYSEQVTALL